MRSEVLTLAASAGCRLTGLLLMLLGRLRAVTMNLDSCHAIGLSSGSLLAALTVRSSIRHS